jgi:hypothetical protein
MEVFVFLFLFFKNLIRYVTKQGFQCRLFMTLRITLLYKVPNLGVSLLFLELDGLG